MAIWADVSLTVVKVTTTSIKVKIGPQDFEFTKEQLQDYMDGARIDPWEFLMRNLGAALSIAGVDLGNNGVLKTAIEGRTFKMRQG